jgi:hypothetical protein
LEIEMAKVQAEKPKSSLAGLFGFGGSKAKSGATRPAAVGSSTATNIPAAGGPTTTSRAKAAAATKKPAAKAKAQGWTLGDFRLPLIGQKPLLTQLQVLGSIAALLLVGTVFLTYDDTATRTRNSTYVSIASQMSYHTQRLAKAAGLAARGQQAAFLQLQDSRDEFANYMNVLQNGGTALGTTVPSAASNEQIKGRLDDLAQRWPDSSGAASQILAANKDLVALAKNIAQVRAAAEELAAQSQELTGLMALSGSSPQQVIRASRSTVALRADRPRRGRHPRRRDHRPGGPVPHRKGHERAARPDQGARVGQRSHGDAGDPRRRGPRQARGSAQDLQRVREERGADPARDAEARVRPPGGSARRRGQRAAAGGGAAPLGSAAAGEAGGFVLQPRSSSADCCSPSSRS